MGTFRGAVPAGIGHFRHFPAAVAKMPEGMKDELVVMFCTGGIRCEKATALALQKGFSDVYQLDGGILRYFERVGSAHYRGACFVFDERVTVAPESAS
jgi:predicted sulfurtransferase